MPPDIDTDAAPLATDYILRRSFDEAKRAILATDSRARAAHEQMCQHYVGMAVARLSEPSTG